jgi:hypothetical protein
MTAVPLAWAWPTDESGVLCVALTVDLCACNLGMDGWMDGSAGLRTASLGISLGIRPRPAVAQGTDAERSGWGRMMDGGVGWLSSGTTVNPTFTTGVCDCYFAAFACTQLSGFGSVFFFLLFFFPFLAVGRGRSWVRCRGCGFGVQVRWGVVAWMGVIARRAKQGATDRIN